MFHVLQTTAMEKGINIPKTDNVYEKALFIIKNLDNPINPI